MRDWSALPTDLIEVISTHLLNDADYLHFRTVCTSWRSAAPKKPHIPWLLVEYSTQLFTTSFLALCNYPNTHLFKPQLPEGISNEKLIRGSSRGWIALLDDAPRISLHNPFTGAHIPLPLLTDFPETIDGYRVVKSEQGFAFRKSDGTGGYCSWESFSCFGPFLANKVVLSSDPATSPQDCVVLALCYDGKMLIHCRPGQSLSWTPLLPALFSSSFSSGCFQDIIFFKGRFYAAFKYRVFVCDIGLEAGVTEILQGDPLFSDGNIRGEIEPGQSILIVRSYLVVSNGDLLLAASTYCNGGISFEVFRVGLDGGRLTLFKLENLGGRALFLHKSTMSFSASNSSWCRGNCIYFIGSTCRIQQGPERHLVSIIFHDKITVYDMEDGSTSFITSIQDDNKHADCWGLHWLTPSLY